MSLDYYGWSHIALVVVYFVIFVGSILVGYKTKGSGSKIEKAIFHGFFTLATLFKLTSFILYILITDKVTQIDINGNLVYLLTTSPSFLYLSVYSIVLLKCFEVYQILELHQYVLQTNRKKVFFIFSTVTLLFYMSLIVLFILDFELYPLALASVNSPISPIQIVIQVIDASIYFLATLCFFIYMYRFWSKYYAETKGKYKYEHESLFIKKIKVTVCVSFIAFFARSPFVVASIFLPLNVWWKDLLYYGLFECIPLTLLMFIWSETVSYVDRISGINPNTPLINKMNQNQIS